MITPTNMLSTPRPATTSTSVEAPDIRKNGYIALTIAMTLALIRIPDMVALIGAGASEWADGSQMMPSGRTPAFVPNPKRKRKASRNVSPSESREISMSLRSSVPVLPYRINEP